MVRIDPPVKRGDSFTIGLVFEVDGYPEDLTTWTIRAVLRGRNGAVVCEFTVANGVQSGDTKGQYDLLASYGQTELATVGDNYVDVQYTKGALRISTPKFCIPIETDITNDNV